VAPSFCDNGIDSTSLIGYNPLETPQLKQKLKDAICRWKSCEMHDFPPTFQELMASSTGSPIMLSSSFEGHWSFMNRPQMINLTVKIK